MKAKSNWRNYDLGSKYNDSMLIVDMLNVLKKFYNFFLDSKSDDDDDSYVAIAETFNALNLALKAGNETVKEATLYLLNEAAKETKGYMHYYDILSLRYDYKNGSINNNTLIVAWLNDFTSNDFRYLLISWRIGSILNNDVDMAFNELAHNFSREYKTIHWQW